MRALMGSLHLLPLGELCELLARRKVTGELACERGSVRKSIALSGGEAVGASSNDPREYLGQLLINFGHLDEEQLAKAFETQQQTRIRLGRVLTMVGVLPPEVVRETLAIKIRETLLDVFTWSSGYFTVDEKAAPAVEELDAVVPLGPIAQEAEFRATAWEAFRATFPAGTAQLALEESALRDVDPRSVDGRLLRLAREGKSIDEIGLALHATDFHLYQRLYALHRRGALRALPATPAPAPQDGPGDLPELLRRGREALAAGRAAEAEALALRAEVQAPSAAPVAELLGEARAALLAELRKALLTPPRTPALRMKPHEIALLRLGSAEKYLLARCDGSRDVAHLARIAPLPELEVLKALRRFVEARIVELR